MKRLRESIAVSLAAALIVCIIGSGTAPVNVYAAEQETGKAFADTGSEFIVDDPDALACGPDLPAGDVDALVCGPELTAKEIEEMLEERQQQRNTKGRRAPVYNSVPGALTLNSGSGSYGYEKLNDFQKTAYEALAGSFSAFVTEDRFMTGTFSADTKINAVFDYDVASVGTSKIFEYLYQTYACFLYDHPQYFFVSGEVNVGYSGNTVAVKSGVASYYYNADIRKNTADSVTLVARQWLDEIDSMSFMSDGALTQDKKDYYTALAVHDKICETIDYAWSAPNVPEGEKWAHSIGGVFTGQGAVCEGFAKAYNYMLNLLEVDNIYIVGMAGGGGHAWNAVGMDDGWFYVDVTWDDITKNNDDGSELGYYYSYFGLDEKTFTASHKANTPRNTQLEWLYELPEMAADGKYFYYRQLNAYSDAVLDLQAAEALVSTALQSQRGLFLQIFITKDTSTSPLYNAMTKLCGTKVSGYRVGDNFLYWTYKPNAKVPATTVSIEGSVVSGAAIGIGGSAVFTAVIPAESDDTVLWIVENVSDTSGAASNSTIATAVRNGKN